jgi:hypothetical protein
MVRLGLRDMAVRIQSRWAGRGAPPHTHSQRVLFRLAPSSSPKGLQLPVACKKMSDSSTRCSEVPDLATLPLGSCPRKDLHRSPTSRPLSPSQLVDSKSVPQIRKLEAQKTILKVTSCNCLMLQQGLKGRAWSRSLGT